MSVKQALNSGVYPLHRNVHATMKHPSITPNQVMKGCEAAMDLEYEMQRVQNPEVRPLVSEAFHCYNTGSIRASVVMTWVAVCADITAKLMWLAEDGDGKAKGYVQKLSDAKNLGFSKDGIAAMQDFERGVLDAALDVELIDSFAKKDLERIRDDRHLCAHPSPRDGLLAYSPLPEVARGHMAIALDVLLMRPSVQGKRMLEAFSKQLADPISSPSSAHILATFYDGIQRKTQTQIVTLAAKHALLELAGPPGITADDLARRMATCVEAFIGRDRANVQGIMLTLKDRFALLESDKLIRAIHRLGEIPEFWDLVDAGMTSRLDSLIEDHATPPENASWPSSLGPQILSLVRFERGREKLKSLPDRFANLGGQHIAHVVAIAPHRYFASRLPDALSNAWSFEIAQVTASDAVIPHGKFLTAELLDQSLIAWANNTQTREASLMESLAVRFYGSTAHLRGEDGALWTAFLAAVRSKKEFYERRYIQLEMAMADDGIG